MKNKNGIFLLVLLLIAAWGSAHTLTVSPSAGVKPGDKLVFTAYIDAVTEGQVAQACKQQNIDWTLAGIGYYVRDPGYGTPGWHTEVFHTTFAGPGLPVSHEFTTAFTVPLFLGTKTFTFELHGKGMCVPGPLEDMKYASVSVTVYGPNPEIFRDFRWIPLFDCFPEPGCPFCLKVKLDKVEEILRPDLQESLEARLVYRDRQVAVLGRVGGRESLPKYVVIHLKQEEMNSLRSRKSVEFTLVFYSGRTIAGEQKVRLNLVQ